MAQNAANVRVAVDGMLAVAPLATAAPTSAVSTLPATWVDLGYFSEDGVTESTSQSSDKIKAWQRAATVRTTITEGESTYKGQLIETKKDTIELAFGTTVDSVTGSYVKSPTKDRPRKSFVLDVIDGAVISRTYIPDGQVTEIGDVVYRNGEPIGYEVTITAYENTGIGGSAKVWDTSLIVP